jgi:hypothetical protein
MTATREAVFPPLRRKNYCSAEKKYFLCTAIKIKADASLSICLISFVYAIGEMNI